VLKKDYLYVASDYYHDANDFLQRYRLTVDNFYATKSKRFKLFVDLRMAAECALKAYIVYHTCSELSREDIINKAGGYNHVIEKMQKDARPFLDESQFALLNKLFLDLHKLPVGLRYRLDGMDYREANEDFYYQTIGDDDWLDSLHIQLSKIANDIGKKLESHSRIVLSGELFEELFEELLNPSFNKYRDRKPDSKKLRPQS
jgi:hypothetical protein